MLGVCDPGEGRGRDRLGRWGDQGSEIKGRREK